MKLINLINKNLSDIKYDIFKFNDGEPHIKFTEEIPHKDTYRVLTRITGMDDLFILLQVGNILERHGIEYYIYITYLMGMRMDRVMTFNEAFSLEIVANMLNMLHPNHIYVYEPHSARTCSLINNCSAYNAISKCNDPEYLKLIEDIYKTGFTLICYPDKGACKRHDMDMMTANAPGIVMEKTRDVNTGAITGMKIADKSSFRYDEIDKIIIIDDLCDGGRTFIEAYKILKEEYKHMPIEIFIPHMVNPNGLNNLQEIFDHVYITNSYKDWESTDKVTVFQCEAGAIPVGYFY